jgi:lipopolysaccharide transport system ATP-binding protein
MSDIAIKCEGLSKRYRIGERENYKSLRDTLVEVIRAPFRNINTLNKGGVGQSKSGGGTFWALNDVSFEVRRGDVIGIIGRNGAGKSTLLKILSRITKPTLGQARINGRVGSLLEVGTGFHPELTGRENIYLNGAILGMSRVDINRHFDDIVGFAQVEKFVDTPVKRYSSGMYLRLAFAVAAHLNPDILIVDEVLAVGDAAFQQKCLTKMEDVSQSGRTVIFVSHNMSAVQRLCKEVIILQDGRTLLRASSREAVEAYLSNDDEYKGEITWSYTAEEVSKSTVLPQALRVRDSRGIITDHIQSSENFTIEVEYLVKEAVRDLRVGIWLQAVNGDYVFYTFDVDDSTLYQYHISRSVGLYTSTCHVPANLLNKGKFHIGLNIGIYCVSRFFNGENLLTINIDNIEGVGCQWTEDISGYIRPLLEWDVIKQPII